MHLNSNKHEIISRMHPSLFMEQLGSSRQRNCHVKHALALNTSIFVAIIQVKVDVSSCVRQEPASPERIAGQARSCDWDTSIASDYECARL